MKILGLDASTRATGYGLIQDGELVNHGVIDLHNSKMPVEERIREMSVRLHDLINELSPNVIYVEEMWSKLNVQVTKSLSYIIGSVIGFGTISNIDVNLILPASWRSYIGLELGKKKREELKTEAVQFVKNKYGFEVGDDEAEGICIAYCGYLKTEEI